jgi:ubiquinone/menaquinone biosynthesis C-methylase UbiE
VTYRAAAGAGGAPSYDGRGAAAAGPALLLPRREHSRQVDHSDPLPYYYAPLTAWFYRRRLEMALDLLGAGPYQRVLEAGYGSGILLRSLAVRAGEVYAVDRHRRTDLVVSMLHAERTPASLMVGDVCSLAYADASFDAVVCISTLEHLHDTQLAAAVAEFHRVLRPHGLAVIGVPASGWVMDLLFRAIGFHEIDEHHVSARSDIEHELQRHFRVEAVRHLPSIGPRRATLYSVFRCRR